MRAVGRIQRSVLLGVLAVVVLVLLPAAARADVTVKLGDAQINVPVQGVDVSAGAGPDGVALSADAGAISADVSAGAAGVEIQAAAPDVAANVSASPAGVAAQASTPDVGQVAGAARAAHADATAPVAATAPEPRPTARTATNAPSPPAAASAPAQTAAAPPVAASQRIGRHARPHVRHARVQAPAADRRDTTLPTLRVAAPAKHRAAAVAPAAASAPVPTLDAPSAAPAPSPSSGLVAAIDGAASGLAGGSVAPVAILVLLAFAGALLARGPRLPDIALLAPAAPFLGRQAPPG